MGSSPIGRADEDFSQISLFYEGILVQTMRGVMNVGSTSRCRGGMLATYFLMCKYRAMANEMVPSSPHKDFEDIKKIDGNGIEYPCRPERL